MDDDSVEEIFSLVYILSMSSLEVSLNWQEKFEHRHVEVVSVNARIWRQATVFEKIPMKRITGGRTAGFELLSFVDIHMSSKGNRWAPVSPQGIIYTFSGGDKVLLSSKTSDDISTIFRGEKAGIPLVR